MIITSVSDDVATYTIFSNEIEMHFYLLSNVAVVSLFFCHRILLIINSNREIHRTKWLNQAKPNKTEQFSYAS